MKFKEIVKDINDFNSFVWDDISNIFPLNLIDDNNPYHKKEFIYALLSKQYDFRDIRYLDILEFFNYFQKTLIEVFPEYLIRTQYLNVLDKTNIKDFDSFSDNLQSESNSVSLTNKLSGNAEAIQDSDTPDDKARVKTSNINSNYTANIEKASTLKYEVFSKFINAFNDLFINFEGLNVFEINEILQKIYVNAYFGNLEPTTNQSRAVKDNELTTLAELPQIKIDLLTLEGKIDDTELKLIETTNKADTNTTAIATLNSNQQTLTTDVEKNKQDIATLDTKQKTIITDIDNLKNEVNIWEVKTLTTFQDALDFVNSTTKTSWFKMVIKQNAVLLYKGDLDINPGNFTFIFTDKNTINTFTINFTNTQIVEQVGTATPKITTFQLTDRIQDKQTIFTGGAGWNNGDLRLKLEYQDE